MIDDAACRWAARLDRGLDRDEDDALSAWLAADRRHAGALLRAQAALSVLDRGRALGDAAAAIPDCAAPDRRTALKLGAGVAAAVVGGLVWRFRPTGYHVVTAIGEIRRLPLEDGSVAEVNSASRLRIAFTDRRRDVELAAGEAWFQVAHNRARPFVVAAGPIRVEAVGTAFDVRRHDRSSEVIVTEGTVRLSSASHAPVLLAAGQQATIDDVAGIAVVRSPAVAADHRLAWREGRIVLDDVTLAAAADEFNRYHVDRLAIDPALADRRVVGWFEIDDIDGFARAVAAMVGGHARRDGTLIRIDGKKVSDG